MEISFERRPCFKPVLTGFLVAALILAPALSNQGFVAYLTKAQAYAQTVTTYSYDNNGNMVGRTTGSVTDTFTYDAENRLISANIQSGVAPGVFTYTYDDSGLRTSTTSAGATTSFLLDKNREYAQVVLEKTGSSLVDYTYGHRLVGQNRTAGGARFYLSDGQFSARQLISQTGLLTDTYTYDAFGELLSSTGTTANNYRYTGEQFDPNSGFYYLRARYYDPAIGRFNVADPFEGRLSAPLSIHRYLYADADPVNKIDPSGKSLIELEVIGLILGILDLSLIGATPRLTAKEKTQGSTNQFILRICPGFQANLGYGLGYADAVIGEDPTAVPAQHSPQAMKYSLFFHGFSPGGGLGFDLGSSVIKFSTRNKQFRLLEDFVGSGSYAQGAGVSLVVAGGSVFNAMTLAEGTSVNIGSSVAPKFALGFDLAAVLQVDWSQKDKQSLEAYRSGPGTLFCDAQKIPTSRPGFIP
jgi:RHS repeat-associated protein